MTAGRTGGIIGEVPSGPNGGSATVGVPNVQTTNAIINLTDVINPDCNRHE